MTEQEWKNPAAVAGGPGMPRLAPVTIVQVRGQQRAWFAVPMAHTALPTDTGELSDWLTWCRRTNVPPVFGVGPSPGDAYYQMCDSAGQQGQDFLMAPPSMREQLLHRMIAAFMNEAVQHATVQELDASGAPLGAEDMRFDFADPEYGPPAVGDVVLLDDGTSKVLCLVQPQPDGEPDEEGRVPVVLQPVARVEHPEEAAPGPELVGDG